MVSDRQRGASSRGWRRRATVALAIFGGLLLVFHRPVLLSIGHAVAVHFAAKENLKINFRLEGNVFTNLVIRNLHAEPTGPSDVESIDLDRARVDYSLIALIRHGLSDGIHNVDVSSARVVLNPARARLRPKPPRPEKMTLPDFFPGRVRLADVTLVVRTQPHDVVMEHVDLELDPRNPGELKIEKLQLVGGQAWNKITAQTSYAGRDLVLRDLVLSDTERIHSLNVDASQINDRKVTIGFDYPIAPGNLSGSILLREAQAGLDTNVHIRGANVPAGFVNKYAALPENAINGNIDNLEVDLTGVINAPKTWTGTAVAQVSDFHQNGAAFDRAVFQFVAGNGSARLQSADITQGKNHFELHGSAQLPEDLDGFARTPATIEIAATAPDLREVTAGFPQKVSGSADCSGKIEIRNGALTGDFVAHASGLEFADGAIEKLEGSVKVSKTLSSANSDKPWFTGLRSTAAVIVSNVKFRQYAIDSIEASLRGSDDLVAIERSVVRRAQNEFSATGEYRLPADLRDILKQPAKVDLALNAVQLGDYWAAETADRVIGPLQVNGQLQWKNGSADGRLAVYGADLRMRNLVVHQLSADCTVANSVVYLNDFTASINEHDFVNASGSFDLHGQLRYRGKLNVNIADLSTLQPALRASGNEKELAGSLVLNWEGNGEAKTFKNTGKLNLALTNGRFGTMQSLQANVDTHYSPEDFEAPTIFLRSDKMDFQAIAQAKGETLEITKIQLDQGQAKYASGYISIPFVWKNLGTDRPVFPPNGKVAVTFQSENLDLKKLFEDFGMQAPVSGTASVKVDASGTLARLNSRFDLQMRDLHSPDFPKLDPASFDLTAIVQNNQLNVNGKLQQAKIQPLELTASVPLDMPAIARAGSIPDNTPVTAKVRVPRTSVNFVRQFVPDLAQLDGDAGLDVDVRGTFGKPVLSGSGDVTINVARTVNPTFPALTNFKARLNFQNDALTVQQFAGELSGGKFSVTGGVRFPKLTQPVLDLAIKSDSALIARNDTLTARANTDVKITGPFNSATVTGTVATTNSQFLKNIDLLPIGLPGRPPPQPTEARPDISFPTPPLRDWKFDVALKTKEPFRIRGNMASGGAVADLHLIGTGGRPGIEGMVRLENVEATLPFSRLEVSYGYLSFDPSDSFNPKIELHGTSVIRDYTIHVYVYGTALSPEAVFTSEPPLPQEEVISLLATGATREELTGNNNVLAGRAATLLVQQLYHKIFKKGGETQSSSVFDRLDVDVGQTDPRTGQRQATARFKVNDQFVLLGDVDVTGGFKGMVKYLIRFH